MPEPTNRILVAMLDRLFASLVSGPSLNCRPHNSRQRVDLSSIARFRDTGAEQLLRDILGEKHVAKATARVPQPPKKVLRKREEDDEGEAAGASLSPEERKALDDWEDQQALLNKLRVIADDAKTYEQDTGVHVLNIGFPLLSLPPGTFASQRAGVNRRIIAPVAFISVTLSVKHGPTRSIELACRGDGVDLVSPNNALLAWLERETGQARTELFNDETGKEPWREISELVRRVCQLVNLPTPTMFIPPPLDLESAPGRPGEKAEPKEQVPAELVLTAAPRSDDDEQKPALLMAAVLGLFPTANQGLLRDMQAMMEEGNSLTGPVQSFLKVDLSAERTANDADAAPADPGRAGVEQAAREAGGRAFENERLVTQADPFQARAVQQARRSETLVIHGPPGTGKSQTIANIIGDHLSRMQRVLLVCDKRTALDVVYNRLEHMGLGKLCALVHDPQRDQRELYRNLRQQLDELAEAAVDERAEGKLAKVDAELTRLHAELTAYHKAVMARDASGHSFHELVGEWLSLSARNGTEELMREGDMAAAPDPREDAAESRPHDITLEELDGHTQDLRETLARAEAIDYAANPWRDAPAMTLAEFLSRPMAALRASMTTCVREARTLDRSNDPAVPPFAPVTSLHQQAEARVALADEIEKLAAEADQQILTRWATQDAATIDRERTRLETLKPLIEAFRGTPLDGELLARVRSHLPAVAAITESHATIRTYADAYRGWADRFDAARKRAPEAGIAMVTQWLGQDGVKLTGVLGQLEPLESLAGDARAKQLDRGLMITYRRQPLAAQQIMQWRTLLDAYLTNAGKWYGFLFSGSKKAALPVAAHFGMTLSVETARQMRDFLTALRQRIDLHDEMKRVLPAIPAELPDDAQLFGLFFGNINILRALTEADPPASADPFAAPHEVIHPLIPQEVAAVTPLLQAYGLPALPEPVQRLRSFLKGLHARLLLSDLHHALTQSAPGGLVEDAVLDRSIRSHQELFDLLTRLRADVLLSVLIDRVASALAEAEQRPALMRGLRSSPQRAAALERFGEAMRSAGLFAGEWITATDTRLRAGDMAEPLFTELVEKLDTLDHVLRIRHSLQGLPDGLRMTIQPLLDRGGDAGAAFGAIRRTVLAAEISRRLAADPQFHAVDAQRMQAGFDRFEKLQEQKRELSRAVLLAKWTRRQKRRLLVPKGSRMNRAGADLRRRLTSRGERALRLRQVVAAYRQYSADAATGDQEEKDDDDSEVLVMPQPVDDAKQPPAPEQVQETGADAALVPHPDATIDPLFDVAPVWMASPETVAQIFPREPLFDVVIFDEASQCRLEEALPVLMRGRRVVIAGDPRQLPPTRFFEQALTVADDEAEPQTEQELFERHQGEIEDLLEAALGLQVDECYLDVHFRSKHADLIEFSNEHFYQSRLQPIPGHPSKQPKMPPVRLYAVEGLYERRSNVPEAQKVCEIVKELLSRSRPPSIGIACFNLPQRDLIAELLDEMAEADGEFEKALEAAYERTGQGSFEGLFVKNLENVQGDERDHMIISTTYGPDKSGRFFRRFGPLALAGGGRRLNVLVTRAREQVHLVSSIPASEYRTLPPIPDGQSPSGAYLLFAYLNYAHRLAGEYAADELARAASQVSGPADAQTPAQSPTPRVLPSRSPSPFARALAESLAHQHGIPTDVHWGNEGFAIDLAIHHPEKPEQVVLGLLCDGTRFSAAADPIEWDIFRMAILEAQGWKLHRIWSPHFFRDPEGSVQQAFRAAHIRPREPQPTEPTPAPAPAPQA